MRIKYYIKRIIFFFVIALCLRGILIGHFFMSPLHLLLDPKVSELTPHINDRAICEHEWELATAIFQKLREALDIKLRMVELFASDHSSSKKNLYCFADCDKSVQDLEAFAFIAKENAEIRQLLQGSKDCLKELHVLNPAFAKIVIDKLVDLNCYDKNHLHELKNSINQVNDCLEYIEHARAKK